MGGQQPSGDILNFQGLLSYLASRENGDRGVDLDSQPGPDAVRLEPCALRRLLSSGRTIERGGDGCDPMTALSINTKGLRS